MKLEVFRCDLCPEFRDVDYNHVNYEMFCPRVKTAIKAVGGATYFPDDRELKYTEIEIPEKELEEVSA